MLVPSFIKPRDAWDFYRSETDEVLPKSWQVVRHHTMYPVIAEAVERWSPGLWAETGDKNGPECLCGTGGHYAAGNAGYTKHGVPNGECQRHGRRP